MEPNVKSLFPISVAFHNNSLSWIISHSCNWIITGGIIRLYYLFIFFGKINHLLLCNLLLWEDKPLWITEAYLCKHLWAEQLRGGSCCLLKTKQKFKECKWAAYTLSKGAASFSSGVTLSRNIPYSYARVDPGVSEGWVTCPKAMKSASRHSWALAMTLDSEAH